jgi:putative Holliday junction resolvase
MSWLGIDYGEKKIGLALCENGSLALPLVILPNQGLEKVLLEIEKLVRHYQIKVIVVGYPLSLAGQVTPQTRRVESFVRQLQSKLTKIKIELSDERFSSKAVKAAQRGCKIRHHDDAAAAAMILQNFLDRQAAGG